MRKRVLVTVSLVIVFGLIVFLNDASKALFKGTGKAIGGDSQLASEEAGFSKGLSGEGKRSKAIKPGFVDLGRRWVPGSEQRRKLIDSHFVPAEQDMPHKSIDILGLAQAREMLLPYARSLQVRAIQVGIPPQRAARLSAAVAAVATRAQLAGVSPAEAISAAQLFGERALKSSLKAQEQQSFMTGTRSARIGGTAQGAGTSPAGVVSMREVFREQQRRRAEQQTVPPQE